LDEFFFVLFFLFSQLTQDTRALGDALMPIGAAFMAHLLQANQKDAHLKFLSRYAVTEKRS